MTSRSLLTGLLNSSSRALTSAVASSAPVAAETENTTNEDYELVTTGSNKTIIEFIERNYGSHSAAKNYHLIDGNILDYFGYVRELVSGMQFSLGAGSIVKCMPGMTLTLSDRTINLNENTIIEIIGTGNEISIISRRNLMVDTK